MSWKIITIKEGEKVNLFLNNLVVNTQNNNFKVPIEDINTIIFENYKTTITTRLITELSKNKILIIFCDENLKPISMIQPFKGNHQQLEIIRNQINWTKQQKLLIWTEIVKEKINSQIDVLKSNGREMLIIEKLFKFIDEIKIGDPTNREGHAAKLYFKEIFGLKFNREEDNLINACLNFGYTILRSAFCRSIVAKGFHPTISLFHSNKYNAFALADDLMEPFRPIIDDFVYKNIKDYDYFSRDLKVKIINILNSKIYFNNKFVYLTKAINDYIDKISKSFEENNFNNICFPIISSISYYEL